MSNGVHNLTNDYLNRKVTNFNFIVLNKKIKEIFYASAHTGVIFDYTNNS